MVRIAHFLKPRGRGAAVPSQLAGFCFPLWWWWRGHGGEPPVWAVAPGEGAEAARTAWRCVTLGFGPDDQLVTRPWRLGCHLTSWPGAPARPASPGGQGRQLRPLGLPDHQTGRRAASLTLTAGLPITLCLLTVHNAHISLPALLFPVQISTSIHL